MMLIPPNELMDMSRAIMVRLDTGEPLHAVLPAVQALTRAMEDEVLQIWVRHEIYGIQKPVSDNEKNSEDWQQGSKIFVFMRTATGAPSDQLSNEDMLRWFEGTERDSPTTLTAPMADLEQMEDVDPAANIWLDVQQYARRSVISRVRAYSYDVASNAYMLGKGRTKLLSLEEELATAQESASSGDPSRDGVFIVHGRDEQLKEQVERLLIDLGIEPVILHQLSNSGRTIIEKLEAASESVTFAIVLLTPDDVGKLAVESDDEKPRARQNVILELGFYIGKLGRNRVCALYKPEVDLPSDYDGVLYVSVEDSLGWKASLMKELESAGFSIDWSILSKSA